MRLCCTYYCIWYRIRSVSGPEADTDCIYRIIQRIHCIAHVGWNLTIEEAQLTKRGPDIFSWYLSFWPEVLYQKRTFTLTWALQYTVLGIRGFPIFLLRRPIFLFLFLCYFQAQGKNFLKISGFFTCEKEIKTGMTQAGRNSQLAADRYLDQVSARKQSSRQAVLSIMITALHFRTLKKPCKQGQLQ